MAEQPPFLMLRLVPIIAVILLTSGCVSPRRKSLAPQFPSTLRQPVAIRIKDERPAEQSGAVRDPKFIYYQAMGISLVR